MKPVRLPESAQLIYADLLHTAWRPDAAARGFSFKVKQIKGVRYHYLRTLVGHRSVEHYRVWRSRDQKKAEA